MFGGDIWTSADYGVSWTDVGTTQNWFSITSDSTGQRLAAVDYSGDIWTSADYGVSWTDDSTTNTATANQNWISITSDSTGQHLAAVVIGGDIWTAAANNPSPALPNNNSNGATGSNTSSSTSDPKAPDTGYGQPAGSDPLVAILATGAIISVGAGLALLYRQRRAS